MQPLYSVDHESRHNTSHMEEQNLERAEESTPLLRFSHNDSGSNSQTTIIVSLLLIILISGVIIGIYLLVLQNESENILPPVDLPVQLVSRSQWDPSNITRSANKSYPYRLRNITVVQTGTEQCFNTESCTKLLQEMQANATAENTTLPYSFMISSNGQTYEALGWHKAPSGLLLALIGDFTRVPPTRLQLQEAKNFFASMVSQQYLHPSYRIIGKNLKETPMRLRQSLGVFPQWNNAFLDGE